MYSSVPLAQVAHPAKYGGLPAVVAKTIEYLEDCALQLEGIFRISGNQSEVLNLKKAFDEGFLFFFSFLPVLC